MVRANFGICPLGKEYRHEIKTDIYVSNCGLTRKKRMCPMSLLWSYLKCISII
uniref:Uncharacterized protein n=1 Tax=Anguilla anguilla TaxID=7936 RepID=A0A0E9RKP7_ANGAN